MDLLSVVRRWHGRDRLSIGEIAKRTGLSRVTIRKYLASGVTEPKYPARKSASKLDPYADTLLSWLKRESGRNRKRRRNLKQLYGDLAALGYGGSYDRVAAFARDWRQREREAANRAGRGTFVPLVFAPGEAFQFDWSEDWARVGSRQMKLQVAHFKLSHSRAFMLRAYPLQTHEMLFDAHNHCLQALGGIPERGIYDNMKTATESPGLAAEDVEQLLTFPIESGMAGLPKVQVIRSVSLFGLSYVAVYFDDDMDIYFARRLVMERLLEVGDRIPEGYGTPKMGPNTSGLGQVFWYTIERADEKIDSAITDMDLRTLHDWTVRLILRTAAGVDDVTSWGGQERQFQVVIDPLILIKFDLTFKDVMDVIVANNRQVGGQYINVGSEQYLVRGLGLVENEQDIGAMVIKVEDGIPVFLRDIATIEQGPALRFGAVTRDGKEVVLGMALSRIGENAAKVVSAVKDKVEIVNDAMPEGVVLRPVYDRTDLVNKAIHTAVKALVEGSILVAIVLFLFLGELRSALVVITALPLAMLIAFIFMNEAGLSANLMSLAGLAVGISMASSGTPMRRSKPVLFCRPAIGSSGVERLRISSEPWRACPSSSR